MKVSFTTLGCPGWNFDEIARKAKEYDYEGVELRCADDGNHISPDLSVDDAIKIGEMFRAAGAPVMSVVGYASFAHMEGSKVMQNQELLRKHIVLARAFKAPFIRAYAGVLPKGTQWEEMAERVGKSIKPLADAAHGEGVKICLETHDDWVKGERMTRVLDVANSKGLRVLYDILNPFVAGENWRDVYGAIKSKIAYCHVKDGYRDKDGKIHYCMLGAGDLPVAEILAQLKADGFSDYLSFEWEKKWHPELEPPERVFPHFAHKVRAIWDAATVD